MDVHVRNSYLRGKDGSGRTLAHGRCGNTLWEFSEALASVERAAQEGNESVRVVLESTTNARAVAQLLERYGREAGIDLTAEVLDARKLRVIAESVTKCDRLDAEVLCDLARSNLKLPVCYVPDDEVFALREHLRARADLVRLRTAIKNRVHALLHRRGILTPAGAGLFSRAGRQFLQELTLDEAGRDILERYLKSLDELEETIRDSTQALQGLLRRPRWAKPAALLQTMPGVGLITALTILAELGDIGRFRRRAAVSNYAGLVPVVRDSNEKHFRGGITGRGSGPLRAAMVEAAWTALKQVPRYAALFCRVTSRKGKPVAIVAVARQMLEDAWTMLRREEAFRYEPRIRRAHASSVVG
jgi:transposase